MPAFCAEAVDGTDGFKSDYFEELAALEEANFWFRGRNELILWALEAHAPGFSSLLEVGCGTGFVLAGIERAFPRARLCGSEIFGSALRLAGRRLGRSQLFRMDARNIPFEDEFDVVGAFDVIEHVEDDRRILHEMFKSLHRGGTAVLTVPQHRFLWSKQDEYACHVRRYERRELESKMKSAGFEIMYRTSFVSLLLPLMLVSRLKKNMDSAPTALDELRLNRALNGVLGWFMGLERMMIKSGAVFPFGGSLLMIARKP